MRKDLMAGVGVAVAVLDVAAFYNSPLIPGPLRRNEVWLALS